MRMPLWWYRLLSQLLKRPMLPPGQLKVTAQLHAVHHRLDGTSVDLGLLSERVVTDAGVAWLVDCLQGLATITDLNWHDSGTGNTAEAVGQTALVTPAGPARVAGTKTEPASNQYRTTATITYSSPATIAEHGLFTASTGPVLFDRSVWAGTAVLASESITYQYTLTVASGG